MLMGNGVMLVTGSCLLRSADCTYYLYLGLVSVHRFFCTPYSARSHLTTSGGFNYFTHPPNYRADVGAAPHSSRPAGVATGIG